LYKLWFIAYTHAFPNFVLCSFIAPSPAKTLSKTKYGIVDVGGVEEGTTTTMEVDSIVAEVATKST